MSTRSSTLPSPALTARLSRSGSTAPPTTRCPVIVYAHGGGWTLLSIDSADAFCRRLAVGTGCTVVSVGYRLAPEHPFPAPFEDVWAVVVWAADGGLGWNPPRLAVAGDSAGGNLAAGVALHARDEGGPRIDLQLLLYPATGLDFDTPSIRELGDDSRFRLSAATMRWFWSNYLGGDLTETDQRAVPAAAASFGELAPAVIVTPGFDPLRDDGRRYAELLGAAGVTVDLVEPATLPHGFVMMLGAVPAARKVVDDLVRRVSIKMKSSVSAPPRALAEEFRRTPFGTHSADLQLLLHRMRAAPIGSKPFLFISQTNEEWVLGRYTHDVPPVPEIDWSIRFRALEDAERYVFAERWLEMFGVDLSDGPSDHGRVWDDASRSATHTAPTDAEMARQRRLLRSPAVLGYANARDVRAGDPISFFVSCEDDDRFDARVVRLLSPSIGPIGPGFRELPVDAPLNGTHQGTEQPIRIGSFAHVGGPLPVDRACTLDVLVHPTLIEPDARTIAQLRFGAGITVTLRHGLAEGLEAVVTTVDGTCGRARLPELPERTWAQVSVSVDLGDRSLAVRAHVLPAVGVLSSPETSASGALANVSTIGSLQGASLSLAGSLAEQGSHHDPTTCFNGKLERPRLFDTADPRGVPVAEWDFSIGIPTSTITDVSGGGFDGTLHNLPTRGIRGAHWSSDHLTWMADPAGYAAIHFHDTDLADAGWTPTLTYDHALRPGERVLRAAAPTRRRFDTRVLCPVRRSAGR